jgi:epoxide hydrolase-like predicted phosphatase
MIKAVIFDWGGVLIDDPTPGLVAYCSKHLKVAEKEFNRVRKKFEFDFQKGKISEEEFWRRVCSELKAAKPTVKSLWRDAFMAAYSEKKEVFSLASSLHRSSYKTGFLSNTEDPAMKFFYEQGYDMFDVLVFSCAEGTRKPEKRIYEIALERLGVKPKEAVFIDNQIENAKGAEKAGMNAILFKSPKQLKKELASFSIKTD